MKWETMILGLNIIAIDALMNEPMEYLQGLLANERWRGLIVLDVIFLWRTLMIGSIDARIARFWYERRMEKTFCSDGNFRIAVRLQVQELLSLWIWRSRNDSITVFLARFWVG
jgi:hypothetical protein